MSMAPAGAATGIMRPRIEQTAPAISSAVSPRTLSAIRKPPICAGVASPDMMMLKAPSASSRDSRPPAATLAMKLFISAMASGRPSAGAGVEGARDLQKILEDAVAVLGGNAFRMELHAVNRVGAMPHAHDDPVVRMGGLDEIGRHALGRDRQRVIARGPERPVDAVEHAVALMQDVRDLAVHEFRRADDAAAISLADRLVAKADAEDRHRAVRSSD